MIIPGCQSQPPEPKSKLDEIKERGVLKIGAGIYPPILFRIPMVISMA
jgi:hypothetical protein